MRPISLCIVQYRILVKVSANFSRRVIPSLIREEQSAFVKGHSIVDNIMISFESIHSLKTKAPTVIGSVAMKVDIFKTYYCVEWLYVEGILIKIDFS